MQSVLIMTKDDNGYHVLQFKPETEKDVNNYNLLKQFVRRQEIELNRLLTPYEIEFYLGGYWKRTSMGRKETIWIRKHC